MRLSMGCNVMYCRGRECQVVRGARVGDLCELVRVGNKLVSALLVRLDSIRRDNVTPLFRMRRLIRDSAHMTINDAASPAPAPPEIRRCAAEWCVVSMCKHPRTSFLHMIFVAPSICMQTRQVFTLPRRDLHKPPLLESPTGPSPSEPRTLMQRLTVLYPKLLKHQPTRDDFEDVGEV